MIRHDFLNRLRILRSIDRDELVDAGIIGLDDFTMWNAFVNDPMRWFLLCDDAQSQRLWSVIERRALRSEVDWNDHSQAARALRSGILPPGCYINRNGKLVIPETQQGQFVRGHSLILAYFDEVVTASGKIVKSRDEAIKGARAL